MLIHTDKKLQHNSALGGVQEWIFIHVAIPADQNTEKTKKKKVKRYQS